MAQFVCEQCGEGFAQRSRYERHVAASHPPRAVTAADVEKALAGIDFPRRKRELVEHATRRVPKGSEVLRALEQLPDRAYRDAAEVAVAFGEAKAPTPPRSARQVAADEPPSRRGGRAAATAAVSAAAVAKVLGGVHFPRSKAELVEHAGHHRDRIEDAEEVIDVVEQLPERRYASMADVEQEVGRLL